jgi:serine/threonine protein kinase
VTLEKGQRLGPYEIEAPAGKGGMGEVYRARDTRLDRTVAIKVLPSHSALNADVRTRFERESKTISSLNHPNVCTLHDVGHENGIDFLVMEFLEGEPLDKRIKRGTFETNEILQIGKQIADALDAAHKKGLVHRDLKPSNIFLTKEGAKLLDFGLAKLQAETVAGMDDETRTTPVTGAGAIVGTLQYMSPEQLEGREANARSDIFSFGATLYEMATGQRAFSGDSKASLIGSIMKEAPRDISELRPTSPPALDRLIKKCLEKDPERRWQTASDLRDELEWIVAAGSQTGVAAPLALRRRVRLRLTSILAVAATSVAVILGVREMTRVPQSWPTLRYSLPMPEGITGIDWPQLSPDGRYIAFQGYDSSGASQIWIRSMNSRDAHPIPGTANARRPFWSPDSRYLAFFEEGGGTRPLRRVPVAGSTPQVICEHTGYDGHWGVGDIILFDDSIGVIFAVQASGGAPREVTAIDSSRGEVSHGWPQMLPDGRHFLYVSNNENASGSRTLLVGDLESSDTRILGSVDSRPVFASPNYVLYAKNEVVVAQELNFGDLEFSGPAYELIDSIGFWENRQRSAINLSASNNGILAWQEGGRAQLERYHFIRVDRTGRVLDTAGVAKGLWGGNCGIELSPDNRRAAFALRSVSDERRQAIYICDFVLNTTYLLTRTGHYQDAVLWSPDASSVAYREIDTARVQTVKYCTIADPFPITVFTSDSSDVNPLKWYPNGKLLCGEWPKAPHKPRLMDIDVNQPGPPTTRYTFPAFTRFGEVSPDDRFIINYEPAGTDGPNTVYINELTEAGRRWHLPRGWRHPTWNPQGSEIVLVADGQFKSVKIEGSSGFVHGEPHILFPNVWGNRVLEVKVGKDGSRLLLVVAEANKEARDEIQVILNWRATLEGK